MNEVLAQKRLNGRGRCCGRKPIVYKRPPHLFCPRCHASFDMDGGQIGNWAYQDVGNGFVLKYNKIIVTAP